MSAGSWSQYFITQQKNESVCETIEQFFLYKVYKMSALLGNSFSSLLVEKSFTFPQFFDQNFIFKLSLFYLLKQTSMTFDMT